MGKSRRHRLFVFFGSSSDEVVVFLLTAKPVGLKPVDFTGVKGQLVPGGSRVVVPSWSKNRCFSQQPVESVHETCAGQRAAGHHVARSTLLATARAHGVRQAPEVVCRRRSIGLVAEKDDGKPRSSPDERAVGQQTPQLRERHRQTLGVCRVDNVDDTVALAQVIRPQIAVTTLSQPNQHGTSLDSRQLRLKSFNSYN